MKRIAYILLLAGVAGLAACSTDDEYSGSSGQNKAISFNAVEASQWQTRGAQVGENRFLKLAIEGLQQPLVLTTTVTDGFRTAGTTAATRGTKVTSLEQLDHFGVSAFLKKPTDLSLGAPDYFYNLKTSKSGDDYVITKNYYWPATDEALHFYAYYPYSSGIVNDSDNDPNVVLSDANATGAQTITFTVDGTVADQVDLMTAVTVDDVTPGSASQPSVTLPFRHELCAVSFKIADNLFPATGGIVSIALKGIYGSGTMTINQDANGTWDFSGVTDEQRNATAFTATINKNGTDNLDNGKMIADNLTFLMIPQELTDDAVIEMVYQDDAQNYTITASLKNALKITDTEDANYGKAFFEAGKTITFALTSTTLSTLKIGTITWPNAYTQTLPKNAYVNGDVAGLYVVQDDNTTIRYHNIPVTFNGTTWEINHSTEEGVVYSYPGDHYYLYYPRVPLPEQDYPLQGQGQGESTADVAFFSQIISGWARTIYSPLSTDTDRRNQSTEAAFTAADLHVAELTNANVYSGGHVNTVGATMKHAMGLAVMTLNQTTVPKKKTYKLSTDANYQFLVKTGTTTIQASADFTGKVYIPHSLNNSTTYLYWVDPEPTHTTSITSYGSDGWSQQATIPTNECQSFQEYSSREYVPDGNATHTLAIGDVYFTDGSLGSSRTVYPNDTKTPAGVVFALNASMSTTDKDAGFTHGYVFSLKDANTAQAEHKWTTLDPNNVSGISDIHWSSTADGITVGNLLFNVNGSGQCGRVNTAAVNALNNLSNYPAFQAVSIYNSTTCPILASAPTNSGWYLPSIAELWLVCTNIGNMPTSSRVNTWGGGAEGLNGVYFKSDAADPTRNTINTLLSNKVGSGYYNPIQGGATAGGGMSTKYDGYYWSSSEWGGQGSCAFHLNFQDNGDLDFDRTRSKASEFRVRPILAF